MKSKLVLISLFAGIFINSIGQIPEGKIGINASLNYAFFGDGDYSGFYFNNGISYSISPTFQICALIGFITSSNKGEDDIFMLHNDTHLLGDIYLKILPINTKKIIGYLGFGSTNRYRSGIRLSGISVKDGETISRYENDFSFDMGYIVQLGFGYKVSTKTMILLNGELQDFNKGTSLYAFGLGINFKL
jgi:hypothetical protein